ncbi:MAG TPA: sugar phosphate isomerase/epimerase [Candidatus Acidoferrum sp.]|nr:sugar phosphate isomerase/epimerase [Candidatus Acidoferrum sp.]
MTHRMPRREFLGAMSALAAASAFPCDTLFARERLYPPMDLSHFDTPITPAPSEIHFGYAAITWGGNDRQAIDDIAAVGFRGIQLRSNSIAEFGSSAAVRDLLSQRDLKFVALSSGDLLSDPGVAKKSIAEHTAHAKFLRDAGGLYLQVIDNRPKGRAATPADFKQFGKALTELGKRTADLGIPLGYHNHMGSLGERPEELDQVMGLSDPRYVKLQLDIAHHFQGGGDPAKAIEKFSDRLLFLHIKDVERLQGDKDPEHSYRFVGLGHGLVDVPAVFESLRRVNFRGWAVVELDGVPDNAHSPKEAAAANKQYLQEKLGMTV